MKRGKYRKAIFAIVYSISKNSVDYAILRRKKHWTGWEFPKGKIELFETKKMAVKREVKEETGLHILNIKKFDVEGYYDYPKKLEDRPGVIGQTYSLFAVEVKKGRIKIDKKEHSDSEWMNFEKAIKKLTWKNQKDCLRVVNYWLRGNILRDGI